MLNRLVTALAALTVSATPSALAQAPDSAKKPMMKMEDHARSGWKELDAFHLVMMQTWHPASMRNNLIPIRSRAGELSDKAQLWSKSSFPAPCDTPALREAVIKAAEQALALVPLVVSGGDEQVKAALKGVHDTFAIVEKGCKLAKPH